jgi:hypothetical protein
LEVYIRLSIRAALQPFTQFPVEQLIRRTGFALKFKAHAPKTTPYGFTSRDQRELDKQKCVELYPNDIRTITVPAGLHGCSKTKSYNIFAMYSEPDNTSKCSVCIPNGLRATAVLLREIQEKLVEQGFAVLSFDRLGVGLSDPNLSKENPTAVDDVKEMDFVMETVKPRNKWFLMDPSMGRVAQCYISMFPKKVVGKTRALIEMENFINKNYTDCFALSITFNSRWTALPPVEPHITDYQAYVLYVVSSRILSMYYGLSLETTDRILLNCFGPGVSNHMKLFKAVIFHILSKEKKKFFILQVDDSKLLVDQLFKLFPSPNPLNPLNYFGILRYVLLNSIRCGGLVMSSLDLEKSPSGSSSIPIDFPERLSSDSIVHDAWLPLFNHSEVDDF